MKYYLLIMATALAAAFSSCHRDNTVSPGPGAGTRTETEVTLPLRLPASNTVTPEAATIEENTVKTAYVLSFRADSGTPDGAEVFDYCALAYSITDGSETRYKSLGVTLRIKDYPQKLVIITNAKKAVEDLNLVEGSGATKDQVLASLEFSNTTPWHSLMDSFKAIPMWGEADALKITENVSTVGTVLMTRMVSRIDVVKDAGVDDDLFTVTSLHLYNHLTNGRISPDRDATTWNYTDWYALQPTLPSVNYHKVKGPLSASATGSGPSAVLPVMYAFESEAPADNTASNATCLVIGGIYEKSGSPSYYRVDFVERDDQDVVTGYKNLLRNHIYRINISDVYGSGRPTPDEAFDSRDAAMKVEVVEWDEGNLSEVVFDKNYKLGVSQTEYTFARHKYNDNLLVVSTDVLPDGWSWKLDEAADWITVRTAGFTGPDAKDDLFFDLDENPGPGTRTAYLTISAGRMSIVVKIIQTSQSAYSLELLDREEIAVQSLLFTSYGDELSSEAQTVRAVWTPVIEDCAVQVYSEGQYGISFGQSSDPFLETSISGGTKEYTIKPDAFTTLELKEKDPFMEKNLRVRMTVGSMPDGVTRDLTLRQIHYDLFAPSEVTHPADGSPQSFTLSTNGTWSVELYSGNSAVATASVLSGPAYPNGNLFHFTMGTEDKIGTGGRSVTWKFTYRGEDGRSGSKLVTVNAGQGQDLKQVEQANCFILEPGGDGVEIELAWANGSSYGQRIAAGDKVDIKVIWLDTNKGIGPGSVINRYKLNGDGASGTIEVYPGSLPGNALIGAYVNGEIKWSWHIWVTGFDFNKGYFTIDGRKWMDVNLGAITNTPGDPDSFGMFYQWGRKDPFSPLTSLNDISQRPLWDESGTRVYHDFQDVVQTDNILTAISHPTTFYKGVEGNDFDWSTSNHSNKSDYLWNEQSTYKKTHFDPCPAGWRVPNIKNDYGKTNPMSQLGYEGGSYNTSSQGWTFTEHGCYWQSCGVLHYEGRYAGYIESWYTEIMGFYWAATGYDQGQYGHFMQIVSNTTPGLDAAARRANGINVRCIEDN